MNGKRPAIDGNGSHRMFAVRHNTDELQLSNLTIKNGCNWDDFVEGGGAFLVNDGRVALTSCMVTGNKALQGSAFLLRVAALR